MINLRKIRYFLAAVDSGSLSAAAAELGISQPTLSQQLAALEQHLKQKLLLRMTTGVMVTEAGRIFYRHARSIAVQIEHAEAEINSVGEGTGQVSLGLATCGAASTLALPLLRRMLVAHPAIRLRLNDNFVGTLSEFIMTGRIDLALAYTAPPMTGVNCRELFIEELVLVAPASLKIRKGRGATIDLTNLRDMSFALLSPIHFLRVLIDRACARAGFGPRVVAEIDSLAALLEAVSAGLGVTILPRAALGKSPAGLTIHRLGPEPMEATVSLCTSAHLPITASIDLVGALVTGQVEEYLAAESWTGVRRFAA
ncbi:MAG: LysR substrate-binding domain-containing protein [Janthinobacterium lividum]